jgi:hypothetical protein
VASRRLLSARAHRRMNFIAGVILMHVSKEADAFDTLDVVIRSNM